MEYRAELMRQGKEAWRWVVLPYILGYGLAIQLYLIMTVNPHRKEKQETDKLETAFLMVLGAIFYPLGVLIIIAEEIFGGDTRE